MMPYFVGKILELPVTTTQDYTLFNILNDYSIDLWKKANRSDNGEARFDQCHCASRLRGRLPRTNVYETLLVHLTDLRREKDVWIATPGEVARWWRQRAEMKLVKDKAGWRIEGLGSERARIAFAGQKDGRISYTHNSAAVEVSRSSR